MGAEQSKPIVTSAHEKARTTRAAQQASVYEVDPSNEKGGRALSERRAEGLSLRTLERWKGDVLKDAKNRYAHCVYMSYFYGY